MMRINQCYLDRFKFFGNTYNYMVSNGLWLSFDKDSLEYIGPYSFYKKRYDSYEVECICKLEELVCLGILDVFD